MNVNQLSPLIASAICKARGFDKDQNAQNPQPSIGFSPILSMTYGQNRVRPVRVASFPRTSKIKSAFIAKKITIATETIAKQIAIIRVDFPFKQNLPSMSSHKNMKMLIIDVDDLLIKATM